MSYSKTPKTHVETFPENPAISANNGERLHVTGRHKEHFRVLDR